MSVGGCVGEIHAVGVAGREEFGNFAVAPVRVGVQGLREGAIDPGQDGALVVEHRCIRQLHLRRAVRVLPPGYRRANRPLSIW